MQLRAFTRSRTSSPRGTTLILERGRARFVAKVPDEVALKIEFEVEDDKTEFEIELTW